MAIECYKWQTFLLQRIYYLLMKQSYKFYDQSFYQRLCLFILDKIYHKVNVKLPNVQHFFIQNSTYKDKSLVEIELPAYTIYPLSSLFLEVYFTAKKELRAQNKYMADSILILKIANGYGKRTWVQMDPMLSDYPNHALFVLSYPGIEGATNIIVAYESRIKFDVQPKKPKKPLSYVKVPKNPLSYVKGWV
jgi:hypothetical protein